MVKHIGLKIVLVLIQWNVKDHLKWSAVICVTSYFFTYFLVKLLFTPDPGNSVQSQGGGIWGGHYLFREHCIGQQFEYASASLMMSLFLVDFLR